MRSPISATAMVVIETRNASTGELQAAQLTDHGEFLLRGSGGVHPLVSPCLKAPHAMAMLAKYVDVRPSHVAGRLLPNGSRTFISAGLACQ